MQRESRADIHHESALLRKVVRTWKSRICAAKMRGEAAGDCEEVDEEGISSSESIGRNESSDCHATTEWGGRLRKRFCNIFSESSSGSWAELQHKQARGTSRKHATKPFPQPAAADCIVQLSYTLLIQQYLLFVQGINLFPVHIGNLRRSILGFIDTEIDSYISSGD